MLEQDFEKQLAAYFEDELDDEGLAMLAQTVREVPAHRRRYQREMRIHTLLRESAMVLRAGETQKPNMVRNWRRITAIAATLVLLGTAGMFFATSWNESEKIGYCLHVSEVDEMLLGRNGRFIPILKNMVLRAGDQILAKSSVQAAFKLDGVGMVTVNGYAELVLAGVSERIAMEIKSGELLLEADHRENGSPPLIIQTPKAEVEVMGTVFGLEVDPVATRVRVHEGRVNFRDVTTKRTVSVNAGQYCVSGGGSLEAHDQAELSPDTLMPGTIRLVATDDLYTERKVVLNGNDLKIENGRRVSYLKFEVPDVGAISGARLRLKQSVDPGAGTLQIWEGSHHHWSERTNSTDQLPKPVRAFGERSGWVKLNQEIEIDVSSLIQGPGVYTMLMTLGDVSNDIWFGSRESNRPPELILFLHPASL